MAVPRETLELAVVIARELMAKEREDHHLPAGTPTPKRMPTSSGSLRRAREDQSSPRSGSTYMMIDPTEVPIPFPEHNEGLEMPAGSTQLPEGIRSLEEWGQTLLDWGKYEKMKLSYHELVSETAPDFVSYRKWITSRADGANTSARHRDLAKYIRAMSSDEVSHSTIHFPGSQETRSFKKK